MPTPIANQPVLTPLEVFYLLVGVFLTIIFIAVIKDKKQ